MPKVRISTRVDTDEYEEFKRLSALLGTSSSEVLRLFVLTFNEKGSRLSFDNNNIILSDDRPISQEFITDLLKN